MKNCRFIYKYLLSIFLLLCFSVSIVAQSVTYSNAQRGDSRDINFEVIGKMNGNILIFKNDKSNYSVSVYDNDMQLKNNINLDFILGKAYDVNFIAYPDFFYLFYQYQQKGSVHCMAAKLDATGKLMSDPVELDNTKTNWSDEKNIYTAISSDDKKKIIIFKIQSKKDEYHFTTLLFDENLKLLHSSRESLPVDEKRNVLSDFFVDNDGNFVFTKASRPGNRDAVNHLNLVIKPPMADSFLIRDIYLSGNSIDVVKFKIDNLNKHYIINSFYYNQRSGNIEGIFCDTWDKDADSAVANTFIPFNDSLREVAKSGGNNKIAFNDFFIRNIIVKKDGGYLVAAEDFSTSTNDMLNNNIWNRWDFLYGNPYAFSPYSYYNPAYNWYYNPYNNPYNNQRIRYYYDNVLVLSIDKTGNLDWNGIINKNQVADDDDNYLSYITFNAGGAIHFLFNNITRQNMLLVDNTVSADGTISRNAPLRNLFNDYEFMPKFGRQVSASEIIVPCTFRNSICFAKIDY